MNFLLTNDDGIWAEGPMAEWSKTLKVAEGESKGAIGTKVEKRAGKARQGEHLDKTGEIGYALDVKTTMIYTHVLNRGPAGVRSPVDGL